MINTSVEPLDKRQLARVSMRLKKLINAARAELRPLAFLHGAHGNSFDELGLRIGRYEPVFTARVGDDIMPAGLIEFIVGQAGQQVQIAGIAALEQFERLGQIFQRSGYSATIAERSVMFLNAASKDERHRRQALFQLMENDAFTASPVDLSASLKNQSTRWPNA